MQVAQIEWAGMSMGFLGGLAIFLFGIEQMTGALKSVAGGGMRRLLARLTTNRVKAVLAGGSVAALIQSSSVTVVLTVGFVSAGLLSLQQAIGVVLGAEIGTTFTAQIIAFPITHYGLAFVALGFLLKFVVRRGRARQYGILVLGFGLLFLGMDLMRGAMAPLRTDAAFLELIQGLRNPLAAILVGALFTGLIQSSAATTGVVMVLGGEGLLPLEAAIAVVFGANIGTCVTGLLASIGRPRIAVQVGVVQLFFNVAGVCLWLPLLPYLTDWMRSIADGVPRQIANAHTLTNVTNTVIVLPFIGLIAAGVRRLIPERGEAVGEPLQTRYLEANLLPTPSLALDRVGLEMRRAGKRALAMVRRAPAAMLADSEQDLDAMAAMDDDVDLLHAAIIEYLARLGQQPLTMEETERHHDAITIVGYIEGIADVCGTSLVEIGRHRLHENVEISASTQVVLEPMLKRVTWAAELAIEAGCSDDADLAQVVLDAKLEIRTLADTAHHHLIQRLGVNEPQRMAAHRVEVEMLESLKRIYYLARRIATAVAETDVPSSREGRKKS